MRAPEVVAGTRVVAPPATLDGVAWPATSTVLRFAPDDVFVIGDLGDIDVGDEHAIVVAEFGFAGCWLDAADLEHVAEHVEWHLPDGSERPTLAQGFVAGVPAKLWLTGESGESGDHPVALLLTNAPYAHELWERLA